MNSLILKDQTGLISDPHILNHINTTLKLKKDDTVKCTILNIGLALGRVCEIGQDFCLLELGPIKEARPQWFNLIIGISRPQTCKKILEHGTTFGAKSFHFFKSTLSEKSYLDSKIFENKAYEEFLLAGLSQSTIYAHLPELTLDKFNPAHVYKTSPSPLKFILDINAKKSFLDVKLDLSAPITLAVGPERGFITSDIEQFHEAGFTSIKISSTILRVEHAVYSAVSQLELLKNEVYND